MSYSLAYDFQVESLVKDHTSLNYDARTLGYDAGFWRTIFGTPVTSLDGFSLTSSGALSYAFGHYGVYELNINSVAPAIGVNAFWGLAAGSSSSSDWILFFIDSAFEVSLKFNGTTTTKTLTWDPAWTSTETRFKIKWFPDSVICFANDVIIAEFKQSSPLVSSIPQKPLGLIVRETGGGTLEVSKAFMYGRISSYQAVGGGGGSSVTVSFPAGTNSTRFQNLGANHTLNVKASAGRVYSIQCRNKNTGSTRYFQLHNKTTAAAGADVPFYSVQVPADSTVVIGTDFFTEKGATAVRGMTFSTGITFAVSTTEDTYTQPGAIEHSTYVTYE